MNRRVGDPLPFRTRGSIGAENVSLELFDRVAPQLPEHGADEAAKATESVDFLIEPGSGSRRLREQLGSRAVGEAATVAHEREGGGRADFIAAARRAAHAAQLEASAPPSSDEVDGAGPNGGHGARSGGFFRARRRIIIVSIAALCLALGAYALTKTASHGNISAPSALKLSGKGALRETSEAAAMADPSHSLTQPSPSNSARPGFAHLNASRSNSIRQRLIDSGLLNPPPVAPSALISPPTGNSPQPKETSAMHAIAGSDPIIVGGIGRSVAAPDPRGQ